MCFFPLRSHGVIYDDLDQRTRTDACCCCPGKCTREGAFGRKGMKLRSNRRETRRNLPAFPSKNSKTAAGTGGSSLGKLPAPPLPHVSDFCPACSSTPGAKRLLLSDPRETPWERLQLDMLDSSLIKQESHTLPKIIAQPEDGACCLSESEGHHTHVRSAFPSANQTRKHLGLILASESLGCRLAVQAWGLAGGQLP